MVKAKQKFTYLADGTVDTDAWLATIKHEHHLTDISLLHKACDFAKKLTQGITTFYGQPCMEQGLEIAEIILSLKLDQESAAAGIITVAVSMKHPAKDNIRKELGEHVAKLVDGLHKMDIISDLQKQKSGNLVQIDKIRKMLLAMATDVRVVIIKLAERLSFMRGIKSIPTEERSRFAKEILDIYAPLANRLGIGQIKWELEDLAFRYLEPVEYKTIATFLAERRDDREKRIQSILHDLQQELKNAHIKAEVTGRAKHIYSIYSKMQHKAVTQKDIYDHSAVRILVPTVEECYKVLSIVNNAWPPISEEFDDYIANPKPNGYRSIHTAVIGADGKHFEIQIRTHEMHEEAERGVAAHWVYKEKKSNPIDDTTKITYLRQLLDWHQVIASGAEQNAAATTQVMEEMIYVITPAGDILDLPMGATPLDFAYHIHSELGHRCRGAKVNAHIVPLTYTLHTGDKVEIHTILEGAPSRDWLNPELGYLKTSRARNKVHHYFKQLELNQDIAQGREHLEKELARSGLAKSISLIDLARHFHLKTEDELFAAVGKNSIRMAQILHAIQPKSTEKVAQTPAIAARITERISTSVIAGASGMLTRFAKCCKPIPGDDILGYITQGSGISIHKKNCSNIGSLSNPARFISVAWNQKGSSFFITDLKIMGHDLEKSLHDVAALFVDEKIKLLNLNSTYNKHQNRVVIIASIQIQSVEHLHHIMHRVKHLPSIVEVTRLKK